MGLLAGGCAPKPQPAPPPPPEPPPATPEILSARRAELRQQDPNAQVGEVAEVLPERHMAALTDLPIQDFHAGDTLVIMNTAMQHVANATVDTIEGRYIVVKYDNAVRDVRPGDLAVRVSEHGRLPGQSAMPQNEPANGGGNAPMNNPSPPESTIAPGSAGGRIPTNTNVAPPPAGNTNTNNEAPLPSQPIVPATRPADAGSTGTGTSGTPAANDNTVPSPAAGTPPPADNARRPELNK
jgi:hypothetical protein